jgi:uncharacterized protein
MLTCEKDVIRLISEDDEMMAILRAAKSLELPDWWVCAGFVRAKVWDTLHGFRERTPLPDVDVIYFDKMNTDERQEKKLEERLRQIFPNIPWSVKNEARMHIVNHIPPYSSSIDAISKFPETASALGVKLDVHENMILEAPWGISDVLNLDVKPTPFFSETKERMDIFKERLIRKNWSSIWKKIKIHPV